MYWILSHTTAVVHTHTHTQTYTPQQALAYTTFDPRLRALTFCGSTTAINLSRYRACSIPTNPILDLMTRLLTQKRLR